MVSGCSPGARARSERRNSRPGTWHKLAPSHWRDGLGQEGLDSRMELEPSWEQGFWAEGQVGAQRAVGSPGWPRSLECCPSPPGTMEAQLGHSCSGPPPAPNS